MRTFATFYKPVHQYWINKILIQTKNIMNKSGWILRFQDGCSQVVVELRVVQFRSKITLVIPDQIVLHSVQLPLLTNQNWFNCRESKFFQHFGCSTILNSLRLKITASLFVFKLTQLLVHMSVIYSLATLKIVVLFNVFSLLQHLPWHTSRAD